MQKLYPSNTFVAPKMPHGEKDLSRLVIAEAPGEQEAVVGEPLVGGAGKIFDGLLRSARINREGLTIANTIQCRPPNNLFPTDPDAKSYISKEDANKAVNQCIRNHVLPLLRSRNWKRVDMLGDKALSHIGLKTQGIFTWRGSPIDIDTDAILEAHKG